MIVIHEGPITYTTRIILMYFRNELFRMQRIFEKAVLCKT